MVATSDMICFALYSSVQAIQKVYRPLLDDLGLTYPQYLVLIALWEAEHPLTVGALGKSLHLESNTLTPLLKRMERSGLVERRRSVQDERRVSISLTDAGRALRKKTTHIPGCIEKSTGLGTHDLATLTDQLRTLSAELRQEGPKHLLTDDASS